jgi:hypothetical protein
MRVRGHQKQSIGADRNAVLAQSRGDLPLKLD